MCGACEKARAKTMLQLFGQPYNNNTLASHPPDQEAMMNRVSSYHDTTSHDSTCLDYNFLLSVFIIIL